MESSFSQLVFALFSMLLRPLRLLAAGLAFLLSPLLLLVSLLYSVVLYLVTLPYYFLLRFKNLYIFCGCAVIIGLLLGSCTALVSHFLKNSLGVSEAPEAETSPSAWAPRADEDSVPLYTKALAAPRSPLSPLIPTILEEEDEDHPIHFTALRRRGRSAKFIAREYGENKD